MTEYGPDDLGQPDGWAAAFADGVYVDDMRPPEPDPFDAPPFDPATGEVLEPEAVPAVVDLIAARIGRPGGPDVWLHEGDPIPTGTPDGTWVGVLPEGAPTPAPAALVDLLPARLADDTSQAVALPGRGELAAFAGNLERALDDRVNTLYGQALAQRPDGPVTEAAVGPELATLAAISDLGRTMAAVFTRMDKGARSLAADVVLEVRRPDPARSLEHTGGSASVRVGVRPGEDVKVTVTQPTETFTDTAGIVDVLVPHLLATLIPEDPPTTQAAYAQGARAMAALLLGELLASPRWKSSALDALRRDLERSTEPGLAGRLDAAYGRRPVGNLQTTVERLDPSRRGKPRTIDGPA